MTRKNRLVGCSLLVVLGVLSGCRSAEVSQSGAGSGDASVAPPPEPEVAALDLPAPVAGEEEPSLEVTTSYCEGAGCAITFSFTHPMIPAGKGKHPTPVLGFDPPQKGTLAWTSPTDLVFTPAKGGFDWGHEYQVTFPKLAAHESPELTIPAGLTLEISVPYFSAANKVAGWPVVRGKPRFVAVLSDAGEIGHGPLLALYDQPVQPGEIAKLAKATGLGGKALKLNVSRPANAAQVWDGKLDTSTLIAFSIANLPRDGEGVTISYPTWDDSGDRKLAELRLTANGTFALRGFSGAGFSPDESQPRAPLEAEWELSFSNPLTVKSLEKALSITPKPKQLRVATYGRMAEVHADLSPGVLYELALAPELGDVLGNKLGAPAKFRVRAADLPPRLALPEKEILLETGRARLPVRGQNLDAVTVRVHKVAAPDAYVAALRGSGGSCAKLGAADGSPLTLRAGGELNVQYDEEVLLGARTGFFCLDAEAKGRGSEAAGAAMKASALVQVTNIGLTAKVFADRILVWATQLSDAAPIANAEITLRDHSGAAVGKPVKTGADGVAIIAAKDLATRLGLDESAYLIAHAGTDRAVVALEQSRLAEPWQFGVAGSEEGPELLGAAVFTERGIYRPGETVHVKAILGPKAAVKTARVTVTDPRGQEVMTKELALDRYGAGDLELSLKSAAAVGPYALHVEAGDAELSRRFHVEEYRVPTFAVAIDSDEKDWQHGKSVHTGIAANYLHGGNLAGREVRWEVARTPERFAPAGFPRFAFTNEGVSPPTTMLSHGKGRLSGEGKLGVAFTPEHAAAHGPMRYTVEASVTDVDRQVYAGRMSRVVHPTAFYVGALPPNERVLNVGDTLEVPVVAVDPAGTARSKVAVVTELRRIDSHGVARLAGAAAEHMNHKVAAVVATCKTTTSAAAKTCRFRMPGPGRYAVRATAKDPSGRTVETGFEITAAGSGDVAWPRYDHERIVIVADKTSYRAGDTAHLVIEAPFTKARGLLTLERAGIIEHRLIQIDGDAPSIDVPITAAHAPNIYASVVLLRGRVHDQKDASGFETGGPTFKVGVVKLAVEPREERLAVIVKPATDKTHPGKTLDIDVDMRDAAGQPRAGQATLMVVDEAVLSLTGYRTPDPVAQLNPERPLAVRTLESRLELPHAQRLRHEQIFPAGDGGDGFSINDLPAEIRTLFQSTAYFNPNVTLDAAGHARVTVKLPDNVTTYRVMAVVIDDAGHAGSAQSSVLVRRPLIVQPVMPRFAYPGDRLMIEARVFNGSDDEGKVVVTAGFEGMKLDGAPKQVEKAIAGGGSVTMQFPVVITGRGGTSAVLKFAGRLGKHADAVEVKLPLLNPGSRRKIVASAQVSGRGELAVVLPPDRQPGTSKLEVMVSTTSLSELKDAVEYLMEYPNGCIEQTTSTAYPLVVLEDLLPEMGVTVDPVQLKKFSTAGIARILSFQTASGGLSYWGEGDDKPHAFATAFGLTALIEGKKRGYDVPAEALGRMANYLEETLRGGTISEEMPHAAMADADTRALFVMQLGRLGRPQPAYVSTLWSQRGKLTPFGLAFLAVAVSEGAGDKSLLPAILGEIRAAAKIEPSEAYYESDAKGGWSMDSPLRTHATALLAYVLASPPEATRSKLLAGLLKRREGGMWGNTQENVFGIMAVAALAKPGKGTGAGTKEVPEFKLERNGAAVNVSGMAKVSERVRRLSLGEADLKNGTQKIVVENAGPPTYVTMRAEYEVSLDDPKNRLARSEGFTIERHYETVAGASLDGKKIPLGSLVRVRLRVVAKDAQHYVAIDDKLPAGLEPLNANLATTEKVEAGKLSPELGAGLAMLSHSEVRDSRVAFYVDEMPAGTTEYVYLARATTAGKFLRPAAGVEAMYATEVMGATSIDDVTVE